MSSQTPPCGVNCFGRKPLELPEPTSFQTAIRFTSAQSIHQETCRAIVLGKDIFYSPNSSKIPLLPPPLADACPRDPLKDSIKDFHNPHWWTAEAAYLPFLLTSPNFHCPPFHTLFNTPLHHGPRRKRRVQMNSSDTLNWNRLENTLTQLFRSFKATYSIPNMPPIIRTSLACQKEFDFPSQFTAAEKRCRSWFAIWMAMVSLGIAIAEITDGPGEADMAPKWYCDFARHTDKSTLSGIRHQLGQFTESFYRAGVFLDLCDPREQPTVDFFVHLNIPVWYRWGPKEESCLCSNPNYWQKYLPQAHLLQKVHSFLIAAPSAASPAETMPDYTWISFFAECERRAAGPIPTKKPPLKVFHWERDVNTGIWSRIAVVRRFAKETLADYGKAQKYYYERHNEWDCCTEMGEKDAEELQADDWESSEDETIPGFAGGMGAAPLAATPATTPPIADKTVPASLTLSQYVGDRFYLPGSGCPNNSKQAMAVNARQVEDYYVDEHSPADTLRLFFGFVAPPPSVRIVLPPITDQQVKDLALGLGCSSKEEIYDFTQSTVGKCATSFFWVTSQTPWVPPPNALFDLSSGNPRSLKGCRRLKFLRQLPQGTYVFDFQSESTVDWQICVADVSLAMFIARLDNTLTDYEIAWALLNQGSPFRTMLRVPLLPPVDATPAGIPRFRLSDYKFKSSDYELYCLERAELLRNPRIARQALLSGGILWRLAMDSASFQSVLAGPTPIATIQRKCMSLAIDSQTMWIDDVLNKYEADIISGVYRVYTGKGNQISVKSWWPSTELWDTLVRQPSWNRRSEVWYNNHLQELASGQGVPLTNTQWRARVKVNSSVRQALANNKNISVAFLKDNGIIW